MQSSTNKLLERAVAAQIAAIEIYNKVDFPYRAESFCVLAVNGWELLLKAKWVKENDDDIRSIYEKDKKTGNIRKTPSGNPSTLKINYVAKKLFDQKQLDQNIYENLKLLFEWRNSVIHFFNSSNRDFKREIHEVSIASIQNFILVTKEWFNYDFKKLNFYYMPLAFLDSAQQASVVDLNSEENNFLQYIQKFGQSENDSKYYAKVNIEVKLIRSNKKGAYGARLTNDLNAPAVRIAEEEMLKKFSLNYQELTSQCMQRYKDFVRNKKYHECRKSICKNSSNLCKVRYLDPRTNKGSNKKFYSTNILQEFDKHYTKK